MHISTIRSMTFLFMDVRTGSPSYLLYVQKYSPPRVTKYNGQGTKIGQNNQDDEQSLFEYFQSDKTEMEIEHDWYQHEQYENEHSKVIHLVITHALS